MTYLVDGRPLQGASSVRGIGSYASGLLGGFAELGAAAEVDLLLSAGLPPPRSGLANGAGVAAPRVPVLHPTLQQIADPLLVAWALRHLRPRLYHGIEFGQPLVSPVPVVMTVHDLIPFLFPTDYPWVRRSRLAGLRLLRRATAVIAVSAATARDVALVARVDPQRVSVVHNGISGAFRPAPPDVVEDMRRTLGLNNPYLLAVGTFDPRKRIHLTAQVARRLMATTDLHLVIAGHQGNFAPVVRAELRTTGIIERTHLVGHVDEHTLAALYSGAECLLFTSAYEGFGLPVAEAMACGASVAVFQNSSMPEVAGPAALMVRDNDAAAMAGAVRRMLADPAEREDRRASGLRWVAQFSWRRAAEATLDVYERASRAQRSRPRHV